MAGRIVSTGRTNASAVISEASLRLGKTGCRAGSSSRPQALSVRPPTYGGGSGERFSSTSPMVPPSAGRVLNESGAGWQLIYPTQPFYAQTRVCSSSHRLCALSAVGVKSFFRQSRSQNVASLCLISISDGGPMHRTPFRHHRHPWISMLPATCLRPRAWHHGRGRHSSLQTAAGRAPTRGTVTPSHLHAHRHADHLGHRNQHQPVHPCNLASFVSDVTIPDNTSIELNDTSPRLWRLKNVGSCTWTSATRWSSDSAT